MPDLEKLIMEIKISPLSANSDNIKQIYTLLEKLEVNTMVSDEVHAVYLLMQSIENKISSTTKPRAKLSSRDSWKKDSMTSEYK
jgi:hypothetical protein